MEVGASQLPTAKPSRGTLGHRPFPFRVTPTGLSPSAAGPSSPLRLPRRGGGRAPTTPHLPQVIPRGFGLGSPPFGRPYSGDPYWFLLLPLLRCFRSGGSHSVLPPPRGGGFPSATGYSPVAGSPIRESPDQRLRAPTRGLSQLATPFFSARAEPSTGWLNRVCLAGASLVYVAAELYTALIVAESGTRPLSPSPERPSLSSCI